MWITLPMYILCMSAEQSRGVNITPVLEHVFGVSKIASVEDLHLLIQALEESDETVFDAKALSEIMTRFQQLKGSGADKASESDEKTQ